MKRIRISEQVTVLCQGNGSLMAQMVKTPSGMQETLIQSLGGEDPLEKEMVTHTSILAWRIPWTEEPGRLQSMGSQSQLKRLSRHTLEGVK